VVLGAAAILAVVPSPALADNGVPQALEIGAGVAALLLAVVLLVVVLQLQRVAKGGAIAGNVSYVVAAAVCLAASVLAGWVSRFTPEGFTSAQTKLASDLLVVAALAFFAIYFWRIRVTLVGFVKSAEAYLTHVDPNTDPSPSDPKAPDDPAEPQSDPGE
jgi:hypothetical protein